MVYFSLFAVAILLVLSAIDDHYLIIPNAITYPLMSIIPISLYVLALPFTGNDAGMVQRQANQLLPAWSTHLPLWPALPYALYHVAGGLLGGGVMMGLYLLARNSDGLGLGNVKLAIVLGVFLGPAIILPTLAGGFFLPAIVGMVGIFVFHLPRSTQLPLGTFLAMAAVFVITAIPPFTLLPQ